MDPFEQMIRDSDIRKKMILQLHVRQNKSLIDIKKYCSLAVLIGFCFALLLFLPFFNISFHQVFRIPLAVEQTIKIFLGVLTPGLFVRAFYAIHTSSFLDNQIKMLKIANYVDEKVRD